MLKDDSISHIDPNAMQVMFPSRVHPSLMDEITYPKNPEHKRYRDQFVRDCLGKKVGNVPANLCGLFRELLDDSLIKSIQNWSHTTKHNTGVKTEVSAVKRKWKRSARWRSCIEL